MDKITKAEIRQRLGNVSKLRELLFGEQMKAYETKSQEYENRLNKFESDFKEFSSLVENRLNQLEKNFVSKISAVTSATEKKISYINSENQIEHQKLAEDLEKISKENYSNIDFLQNSINDYHSSLKLEITQSKSTVDRDLQLLKRQIHDQLEANSAKLSSTKLSHNDLANVLFELCLKLKDPSASVEFLEQTSDSELKGTNSSTDVDLILPEKK